MGVLPSPVYPYLKHTLIVIFASRWSLFAFISKMSLKRPSILFNYCIYISSFRFCGNSTKPYCIVLKNTTNTTKTLAFPLKPSLYFLCLLGKTNRGSHAFRLAQPIFSGKLLARTTHPGEALDERAYNVTQHGKQAKADIKVQTDRTGTLCKKKNTIEPEVKLQACRLHYLYSVSGPQASTKRDKKVFTLYYVKSLVYEN